MAEKKANRNAGHRERMRQRYLLTGFKGFQPHEIIEFLLFNALPRRDTNKIAHDLINRFGSVAGVLDADVEELCTVDGISKNSAVFLSMLPDLFREYKLSEYPDRVSFADQSETIKYLDSLYIGEKNEKMYVICLDAQLNVINTKMIGGGSTDTVFAYSHCIVEAAMLNRSSRVVLVHNHPDGNPQPSDEDIFATNSIYKRLKGINITLEDHFIVGKYVLSLRKYGYIDT